MARRAYALLAGAALILGLVALSRNTDADGDLPVVRGRDGVTAVRLTAITDKDGRSALAFEGRAIPPVLHVAPGGTLRVRYENRLSARSGERCARGPCRNMTNLHFHGLHVSPRSPQDDVLGMSAMPGETLNYLVSVPRDHAPGLYWYHTHPHGESHRQALDGMSGAIVVDGIERYVPGVANLRERILVLRARDIEHDPEAAALKRRVAMPSERCGAGGGAPERLFTVNGAIRPTLTTAPGERQFWRIVNAAADQYADLQIPGRWWQVVALDGMPLAYHESRRPPLPMEHVLLPPGGRLEAIVTGPPAGQRTILKTRCIDTGPDGDANPEMVIADVVSGWLPATAASSSDVLPAVSPATPLERSTAVTDLQASAPQFVVTFTEDVKGFYIHDRAFAPTAPPLVRVAIGSYQHWRVVNRTREIHPFHIHQTHFLAYAENDVRHFTPLWLDTVNVPAGGSVDLIMDFSDPAIREMSVFHCHLLNHEDKGMMAKILFE
jgi:FtsP/CotA-like multicopper oxidase with cupredoxin domain